MSPGGRSFHPLKTSVKNLACPNPLKMSPGSTNTAAVCQPQLLVAEKAKLFPFSEWCCWSHCRVGVGVISHVDYQGSQKGWGKAGARYVQWCSWLERSCIWARPYCSSWFLASFSAKGDAPAFGMYWLAEKIMCAVMLSVGSLCETFQPKLGQV